MTRINPIRRHHLTLALVLLIPSAAEAQLGDRIRRAATRAAESEATRQIEKRARDGVRCVFDDLECIRQARSSGKEAVLTDDGGEILRDADGSLVTDPGKARQASKAARPGEGAWANYDFVPGDEILLYEDFTNDRVGDFPRRFELIEGSFEIIDASGERLLRAVSGGLVAIPLPRELPERFTVEFPVSLTHGNAYVRLMPEPAYYGRTRTYRATAVSVERTRTGVRPVAGEGPTVMASAGDSRHRDALTMIRVMADGDYLKVYHGERRIANVPNAVFPRTDRLFLAVGSASENSPILIGTVRIAAGGLDLYGRLDRDGRVATQGILFATNSDRIRPESTPTLEAIASMLREHPSLRLSIEGHTDSDGDDGYNQQLSQRRSAAVRAWLVEAAGIDGGRLQTTGFGESRPAADNASPEGKQQNRRVELVRLGG